MRQLDIWNKVTQYLLKIDWTEFGLAILIFLVFLLLRKLFTKYLFRLIIYFSKKTPTEIFTNILLAFERPLRVFFVVLGAYLSLEYLDSVEKMKMASWIGNVYASFIIALLGWGLYNYTSEHSSLFYRFTKKIELDEDSMIVPFLSKLLRFAIIAITLAIILEKWGYKVNGLVAGLGLGGLAFALAAQDTISNFFGGVIIVTERPFSKGDWILTPTVEGTVEDITFRSTKIRTFANALVTVPNSKLASEAITNWSEMKKRRITFNLRIAYHTPREKLEKVTRRIEALIKNHEEVHKDLILVNFDTFNESSYDIYIYFFTITTEWKKWLEIKEDINFKIIDILNEEGVEIAFPIRKIHVEQDGHMMGTVQSEKRG